MRRLVFALLLPAACLAVAPRAWGAGPGLGNVTYTQDEIMHVVGHLGAENGAPRGHGTASLVDGYAMVVFSRDSGEGQGGLDLASFDRDFDKFNDVRRHEPKA